MGACCKAKVLLAGTILYGLGVLLQSAHNVIRSPLFVRASEVVGILMLVGLAVQTWGMVARFRSS